jgi:hypothetical protein
MIRSLFNLSNAINKHITNLPKKTDFNLKDVKPILEKYDGNDWYDYKIKNSYKSFFDINNYSTIPVVFDQLKIDDYDDYDDLYGMYIFVWNPYCHTSIQSHPEGDCLMKILDGNIIEQKFINCDSFSTVKNLKPGDISFNSEEYGLQRICNNNLNYAYSLNLYTPNILSTKYKEMCMTKKINKLNLCGFAPNN